MPKDKIIAFIDFFHPLFKKVMPLQTFRYAVCGGFNVAFGFLVYAFTYHFVLHKQVLHVGGYSFEAYSIALCCNSISNFIVGFLLNKYVVFPESNLRGHVQLFRYFIALVISFCLNYILLKAFVDYGHLNPIFAQVIATVIVIGVSYVIQRYFTFKVKKEIE